MPVGRMKQPVSLSPSLTGSLARSWTSPVYSQKLTSAPGTVGQIREAATQLLFTAKGLNLPTVLVGHSFAGTIISEAGVDPKVAALVYVAARAPDAGEDYPALAARFPRPPATDGLVTSGGFAQLNEESFLKYFAGDVDPVKARILYAVQGRVSTSLFSGRTTCRAAWRSKPSWYQISANDKTISPELQRFMADRMKAKTIELPSSHVSLISHPQEIAALIFEAASA